ncbi:MAG: response regulator [Desulfobacterales bacterium]|jgi:HD-like signal output (HDOD) protein|nr:response regulator [Desulfobacterales bacterium]
MTSADRRFAVVFVDDEPLVLQGLQRMLRPERERWDMRFVRSGAEALGLLEREPFDAVVSDLRMPEMDGAALLAAVMDRHPHMARIVLSGEMDRELTFRTVHCAHQFLSKPCDADTLKLTLARASSLRRLLNDRKLKSLLPRLESLPSLPSLYTEILTEIQAPNSSFRKVGDLVARDLGMTAKILQLVNSAFFGLARRVASPQDAVSLLGYDTVRALVLSAKIFSQVDLSRIPGLWLDALWQHSFSTSLFARAIGVGEKLPRKAQDEAFTAGILHDLGQLILAQNFPDAYAEAIMLSGRSGRPLWEIETERFGASHAELGAYLLGLWGIGEDVVGAVAQHHQPPPAGSAARVTAVVFAANLIEHRLTAEPTAGETSAGEADALRQLEVYERIPAWEDACRKIRLEEALRA